MLHSLAHRVKARGRTIHLGAQGFSTSERRAPYGGREMPEDRPASWGGAQGLPLVPGEPEKVHVAHMLSLSLGNPPTAKPEDGV